MEHSGPAEDFEEHLRAAIPDLIAFSVSNPVLAEQERVAWQRFREEQSRMAAGDFYTEEELLYGVPGEPQPEGVLSSAGFTYGSEDKERALEELLERVEASFPGLTAMLSQVWTPEMEAQARRDYEAHVAGRLSGDEEAQRTLTLDEQRRLEDQLRAALGLVHPFGPDPASFEQSVAMLSLLQRPAYIPAFLTAAQRHKAQRQAVLRERERAEWARQRRQNLGPARERYRRKR